MYLDVYVGRLDDSNFVAKKDTDEGAVPSRHSPPFPNGSTAFRELVRRIELKLMPGEATQHIAYVSPASEEQIAAFYAHVCGQNPLQVAVNAPIPNNGTGALRAWIRAIIDDGNWCLVGIET